MQNKSSYSFKDFLTTEALRVQTSDLMTPHLDDTADKDLEGDYVDLLETAVTAENRPSISCHQEMGDSTRLPKVNGDPISSVANNKWVCGRTQTSEEGVCTPCLRRKLNKDLNVKETKCRFRQSYLAALKNPVKFISAPMAEILEETASRSSTFAALESPICSRRKPQSQASSSRLFLGKADSKAGDIQVAGAPKNPKVTPSSGSDSSSPSLVHRFSFLKGQRGSSSSGDGLSMDSSSNQYGGTWRRVSAVCSPRLSRAKFSGKGSIANTNPSIEVTSSVQKVPSKTGLWVSIVGSPSRGSIPWETITDLPIQCQDLSAKLLYSGIACLPGSRDKLGRAIIQVTTDSTAWDTTWCSVREVARLFLYLFSVARKEIRDLGLMILVDARKHPPSPCLHAALQCAQASSPGSIQSTVILVEKETAPQLDRMPGLQVEILTSLKSLGRYVDIGQLTWDLGGTYPYCHSEWVQFYQKLDAFSADLRKASDLLQHAIQELGEGSTLQDSTEAEEKMGQYRELMKVVLSDSRLVSLQREGGTTLARLRKEATRFYCSQDVRSAVESAVQMYNHLEERVHALVTKSNRRLDLLESMLKIQELEKQFNQLSLWMNGDGENQLHEMDTMEWALETLEKYHKKFKEFFLQATVHYNHGLVLLDDANKFSGSMFPEMDSFKVTRGAFQTKLSSFYINVEKQKEELEKLLSLYRFCDKITQLTMSCSRYAGQLKIAEQRLCQPETQQCLETYLQRLTEELSDDKFQEMKEESYKLSSCRGLAVWNETWLKCQEAKQLIEETLEKCKDEQNAALAWHKDTTLSSSASKGEDAVVNFSTEVAQGSRKEEDEFRPRGSMRSAESTVINCCSFGLHAGSMGLFLKASRSQRNARAARETLISQGCSTSEETKNSNGSDPDSTELMAQNSNNEALEILHTPSPKLSRPTPIQPSSATNADHFTWISYGRANSDDSSSLSDSSKIKQSGRRCVLSRHASFSTGDSGSHYSSESSSAISPLVPMEPLTSRMPWMRRATTESSRDNDWTAKFNFAKLHRIMEELLATERDYVCSLGYVLSHYLSEMDQPDLPPALRGQHAAIFGNLEKLYEFHSHTFLQELTSCRRDPSHVGRCFLKHKEQFGLYAFYSKNKPQSDRLLQEHGTAFFKRKQQELGDKMDISSYLLKPIQRISKYNLLLQDMEWECKGQNTREAELKSAREVVRFQLRHGNDLLAMDDIQDCDVNLKEQGRLLRQGEFVISYKKRKCLRRVFLFEDLILFSKTKKAASGREIYVYKQSFKTSEIGLTHTLGGSGLCFEIWFRRRKLEDTYTFQAPSPDIKEAWTGDLQKILWDQAIKNREMRRQERAFSGLGCKPFTDIQPSEAAISSRAIPLTGNGDEHLRSSTSVALPFPTSPPPLRSMSVGSRSSASSAVSLGGCSSTSSGRGSLSPLHGCPGPEPPWRCCRAETSHDKEPSVFLTASSGSSEGSVSGFSSPESSQIPVTHINTCYPLECWRPLHVIDKPPENNIP